MATPTVFSVNTDNYLEGGYVHISWSGTPSVNHYSYRVYRMDPDGTWALLNERSDTAATYTFDDYTAPSTLVRYAVVEVTAIDSVQTEEAKAPRSVTLYSPYYWLIHPTDHTKNIQLRSVYTEDFQSEHDQDVKKLIGRGRKIDVGDDWGRTGSLSGRIMNSPTKTAREIRQDLENSKADNSYFYLRNSFGDNWKIWFEDPKFSRVAGVGDNEFVDVSFTYYEVA